MNKKNNHEADIKNANKKTKGHNKTFIKNQKNRDKQLQLEAEKRKRENDHKSNINNPNNPLYKLATDNRLNQLKQNNLKHNKPQKKNEVSLKNS